MQFASFPFDWIGGRTIRERADDIANGFPNWMIAKNFTRLPTPPTSINAYYRDEALGYLSVHDFPVKLSFGEAFPQVREKFMRRTKRLLEMIEKSKRILIFWVGTPAIYVEGGLADLKYVKDRLESRWPGKTFDVLAIDYKAGVKLDDAQAEDEDGITLIKADVKDSDPTTWIPDEIMLAEWLRKNYEVIDYRSEEERKEWQERKRRGKLNHYKGKNFFDRILAKYEYKLYKHFLKRMDKRGML